MFGEAILWKIQDFCIACGHGHGGCEPDARGYECEACGENEVYGDEELLLETATYEQAVAALFHYPTIGKR